MGIPGFFGFIRKYNQNGQIIKDTLPFPNCSLFLDFNGAIYTAYYKYKHKSIDSIINNILNYLDILVKIHTEKNNLDCLETNIIGTKNVLEISVKNNIKKFIFASSSEIYGEQKFLKKLSLNLNQYMV